MISAAIYYRKFRAHRRRVIIAAAVIVILIIILLVWLWARSSNQGSIVQEPNAAGRAQVVGDKVYDGSYISFTYPGGYLLKTLPAQPPTLEAAMLTADTNYDKHIAVSVQTIPPQGLAAEADYEYRQVTPSLYTQRQLAVDGASAIIWVKKDGSEQTAFIPHGNNVAAISLSMSDTNAPGNIQAELDQLLASFHWKQ